MSTLKSTHERYHHGDLKNVLLASGVQLLAEEGLAALSLRSLARRAGVSHNAPYQHFTDKEAFLAALAEQGFHLMGEAMATEQAQVTHLNSVERLATLGCTYVQFALEHPSHMQVMFIAFDHERYPTLAAVAFGVLGQLLALVEGGQAAGELRDGDPRPFALLIWTTLHGLSLLAIADKIPDSLTDQRPILEVAAQTIRHLCQGIATPGHP